MRQVKIIEQEASPIEMPAAFRQDLMSHLSAGYSVEAFSVVAFRHNGEPERYWYTAVLVKESK